ncbi:MAG: glycosyltransferase family 4 protein [Bacteroidetes bacterium]|nr:glycosyltransferase family 4 protein [Bacteroidota bacterium]
MKIALLTDGIFPYAMGGMQKHSYYLAKYFAQKKVEVHLYHCIQNTSYDSSKLEFFTEEEKHYLHSYIIPFPKAGKLPGHYLRESFKYSEAIYTKLKQNAPVDFIYIQGFAGWKILKAITELEKFPRTGINFHGMEPFQQAPGIKAKLQQLLLKRAMRYNLENSDRIFSLGGNLTQILLDMGFHHNRIIQIPIGIEADEWINPQINARNSILKFVFVGRYERRKGIEELTKAIELLPADAAFEFHFIGPIPDEKKLKDARIKYHGAISDQHKIKELITACDVLVCASYAEGMPTVILEAFACGLAAIATDVGAVNELVSEKTGWLLAAPKVNDIRTALIEAIEMPPQQLLHKKQQAQQLLLNNHRWDKLIVTTINKIAGKI